MTQEYRHNHYVPQWYQRRFMPSAQRDKELWYLDLRAGYFVDASATCRPRRSVKRQGTRSCFAQRDLYTTQLGAAISVDIEKYFFGEVDDSGRHSTDYFANFAHPSVDGDLLRAQLRYMTTQRLRTPKGLAWLLRQTSARSKDELLAHMQSLETLFGAIWCESIWQIADACTSNTKFILSDHPVTFYNRDCAPASMWGQDSNDPDIRWHGTNTIFPLSLEKVLIITNISWVRNPYQHAREWRPNPKFFRAGMFNFQAIQTHRSMTEHEVRQINYIVKRRAYRFVAAAVEDWLFPEAHVDGPWRQIGDELLLMPDPRSVQFSGRVIVGHEDGRHSSWDEYGLRPWQRGFDSKARSTEEWKTFHRFRGEFARRFGPDRRGRAMHGVHVDPARDSDEMHEANLRYETDYDRFVSIN